MGQIYCGYQARKWGRNKSALTFHSRTPLRGTISPGSGGLALAYRWQEFLKVILNCLVKAL